MSEEIFVRRASGLVRELEWYDVAIWALATPAASGMTYYSVKLLGANPGGDITLGFILAGLMWIPLVALFAVLSASFPRSSSLYVLSSRVVHPILGYLPFWLFIIGGGSALACGLLAFISIKALAGSVVAAGYITGDPTLLGIGGALVVPTNQLIVALVILAFTWLFNMIGMRAFKWVIRVVTVIPFLITLAVIFGLLMSGPGGGVASWDAIFKVSTDEMTKLALEGKAMGVEIDVPMEIMPLWAAVYGMFVWTIWAYTGFECPTFVGSEVKVPKKGYFRGFLLGMLAIIFLYVATAALITTVYPIRFLESYSYLQMNYKDTLEGLLAGPAPDPSVPFFASILFRNPIVAIVLGLGYFLWFLNTNMIIWVAGVRGFFSMAFDRMLPERFANVTAAGSPTWANHLIAIVAFIGAFITLGDTMGFELATSIVAYLDFSCLFFVWPVGLAAMLLPYVRSDLFGQCVLQRKVVGIPILSILGAITFAVGWFFMILTAYTEPLIVSVNIAVAMVGLIVFTYEMSKNIAKGIDVKRIYTEIPPA